MIRHSLSFKNEKRFVFSIFISFSFHFFNFFSFSNQSKNKNEKKYKTLKRENSIHIVKIKKKKMWFLGTLLLYRMVPYTHSNKLYSKLENSAKKMKFSSFFARFCLISRDRNWKWKKKKMWYLDIFVLYRMVSLSHFKYVSTEL